LELPNCDWRRQDIWKRIANQFKDDAKGLGFEELENPYNKVAYMRKQGEKYQIVVMKHDSPVLYEKRNSKGLKRWEKGHDLRESLLPIFGILGGGVGSVGFEGFDYFIHRYTTIPHSWGGLITISASLTLCLSAFWAYWRHGSFLNAKGAESVFSGNTALSRVYEPPSLTNYLDNLRS